MQDKKGSKGSQEARDAGEETYREMTYEAVILGIFQGILLNLAFVYAALKLGFSVGGSTVAAIVGYAVLRGILRKGSSVENNINQTIASGINVAGTGVVFTLPALFLVLPAWGQKEPLAFFPFLLAGLGGAILGVVLIVPLRRQMIEMERLRFPTGIAVWSLIRSGSSGIEKAKLLAWGCLVSALWKCVLLTGWLDQPGFLQNDEIKVSFGILPDYTSPWLYLSVMNFAVGMLAGRGGLSFFLGGAVAWWGIAPLAVALGWTSAALSGQEQGDLLYASMLRPLGIGVLIGGALMGVVMSAGIIASSLRSLREAAKAARTGLSGKAGGDEMPFSWLKLSFGIGLGLFFFAIWLVPGISFGQALLATILGTVWLGLAGMIVAQATGMTDISPMSGMSLISVTFMMVLFQNNVAAAMIVGVAVCVAIGQAADMMQDLKTGFLLGGRPIKQQIAQLSVTWLGSMIALAAVILLWKSGLPGKGGFGPGTDLPAPQASVLAGLLKGLTDGQIPLDKYILGGILGLLLGAAPVAGMGVLIGLAMYLPFSITLGYGLGCLTQMALAKKYGESFYDERLVPLGAGLIVGEALIGIGHTALKILVLRG